MYWLSNSLNFDMQQHQLKTNSIILFRCIFENNCQWLSSWKQHLPVSKVVGNKLCLIHIKTLQTSIVRAVFNSNSRKKRFELLNAFYQWKMPFWKGKSMYSILRSVSQAQWNKRLLNIAVHCAKWPIRLVLIRLSVEWSN